MDLDPHPDAPAGRRSPVRAPGRLRNTLISVAGLTMLLVLLDQLYRWLHPEVNPVRATLVGLTALAALAPLWLLRRRPFEPWLGALSIFASAMLSVLLIQAGLLTSRSKASAIVHVLILAAAFSFLDGLRSRLAKAPTPVE